MSGTRKLSDTSVEVWTDYGGRYYDLEEPCGMFFQTHESPREIHSFHHSGQRPASTCYTEMTLLVFTLRVVAGDVERHTGPIRGASGTTNGYTQSQVSFPDNENAERRVTRNSSFSEVSIGLQEANKIDRILDRLDGIGQHIFYIDTKFEREIKLVNERLDGCDNCCAELQAQNYVLFEKMARFQDESRKKHPHISGCTSEKGDIIVE
jgi:hypothetical protein